MVEIKKNQQRLPRETDAHRESSVTIVFIPSVVFTRCLGTGTRAGDGKGPPLLPGPREHSILVGTWSLGNEAGQEGLGAGDSMAIAHGLVVILG